MAWNSSGTRCGLCSRFFCCSRHRLDHQSKAHGDVYTKEGQDLLQYFQRRAEIILLRSKQTRISVDAVAKSETASCKDPEKNSNNNEVPGCKRRHLGPILTETYASIVQRKILVPKYRLRCSKQLSSLSSTSKTDNSTSKATDENRSLNLSGRTLKTSTPNVKALSEQNNWDEISPASTISDLLTPLECGKLRRAKGPITPLRSIMAKMSKYQSLSSGAGDSGPHGRRVTFSFSGQLSLSGAVSASGSGSTLQDIHEVDAGPDENRDEEKDFEDCLPYHSLHCAVHSTENRMQTSVHEHYIIKDSLADSPPTPNEVGFFSCITGMFCSAVQTIPGLSSLRSAYRDQPKRSRSPVEEEGVPHKKPCLTCDLRENPIKCRKPISSSSLKNGGS